MILTLKNIKVYKNSYYDILIYYTEIETPYSAKLFYINFNKINGYIEDNNESKNLEICPVDEDKGEIKKYKGI